MERIRVGCGSSVDNNPQKYPIRCPPTTLRGLAVKLCGKINTINAVAPIEAITIACCILRTRRTRNIEIVARVICSISFSNTYEYSD